MLNKISKSQHSVLLILIIVFMYYGCNKQAPKDTQNHQETNQMPDDSIHKNLMKNQNGNNEQTNTKGDEKAEQLSKEADDADIQFQKTKSRSEEHTSELQSRFDLVCRLL